MKLNLLLSNIKTLEAMISPIITDGHLYLEELSDNELESFFNITEEFNIAPIEKQSEIIEFIEGNTEINDSFKSILLTHLSEQKVTITDEETPGKLYSSGSGIRGEIEYYRKDSSLIYSTVDSYVNTSSSGMHYYIDELVSQEDIADYTFSYGFNSGTYNPNAFFGSEYFSVKTNSLGVSMMSFENFVNKYNSSSEIVLEKYYDSIKNLVDKTGIIKFGNGDSTYDLDYIYNSNSSDLFNLLKDNNGEIPISEIEEIGSQLSLENIEQNKFITLHKVLLKLLRKSESEFYKKLLDVLEENYSGGTENPGNGKGTLDGLKAEGIENMSRIGTSGSTYYENPIMLNYSYDFGGGSTLGISTPTLPDIDKTRIVNRMVLNPSNVQLAFSKNDIGKGNYK